MSSRQWLHLPSCGSTNDEATRLGRAGAPEGTVVTAGQQTSGRGRQGRRWHSPPDENLYLSVLLRPQLPPQRAPLLCLCAGLALHEAVSLSLTELPPGPRPGPRLRLKWPNDLLGMATGASGWSKLGGVLMELVCAGSAIDFVVVGIGCNVNSTDFPPELTATSLRSLAGDGWSEAFDLRRLAGRLVAAVEDWSRLYVEEGAAPIIEAFAAAAGLGPGHRPITVSTVGRTVSGVPVGLGLDGELLLHTADGVERILTGEVALSSLLPDAA